MTRFTAFAAALLMTAGAASAQVTTQESVGGASGIADYPTLVLGENGVTYACKAPTTINGIFARPCINANAPVGFEAVGAGTAAGIAAAIVLVAVIANNDDDTVTTTTTTN